jgi:hypothetical protein
MDDTKGAKNAKINHIIYDNINQYGNHGLWVWRFCHTMGGYPANG